MGEIDYIEYCPEDLYGQDETEVEAMFIKASTEKAFLAYFADGREEWFPKSLCSFEVGDRRVTITCPIWMAEKKDLI